MYNVLLFVVVFLSAATIQELRFPYFPWRTSLDGKSETRETQSGLCELPPYPERGGYVAVDEPDARPGDVFRNVSLVQYETANRNEDKIIITALHCSVGEWFKSVFEFQSEGLYLNASWCPLLCSSYESSDAVIVPQLPKETHKTIEANPNTKSCVLPQAPAGGGYYVKNLPNAKAGFVYDHSATVYTYEPVDEGQLYKIKLNVCNNGSWSTQIWKLDGNSLEFTKSIWCPFLCTPSATKKPNVSPIVDDHETLGNQEHLEFTPVIEQKCVLPKYPKNGNYIVINKNNARPDDVFDNVSLILYMSNEDFELEIVQLTCAHGTWTREIFKRIPWPIKLKTTDHLKNQEKRLNTTTNPGYCKLPPYPEHGLYVVTNNTDAAPGDESMAVQLEFTCEEGYSASGADRVRCENGTWYDDAPKCARGCNLNFTTEVYYLCKKQNSDNFSTLCLKYHPHDAEVLPICDTPYYRSSQELSPLKCVDGKWNYTPTCLPECGIQNAQRRFTPFNPYVAGGRTAQSREVPWHVGVYNKLYQPYMQICSGSIISPKLVVTAIKNIPPTLIHEIRKYIQELLITDMKTWTLSDGSSSGLVFGDAERVNFRYNELTAHCFWSDLEGLELGSRFAVAAGKLYRPWRNTQDDAAQFSDVSDIIIPKRFRGAQTNFQDDIAIMYLTKSFVFDMDVWPVCLDFNLNLDRKHLAAGNLGKVAGWGLTDEDGKPSPVLQIVQLPYVEIDQCIADASPDFRTYITSDKICAGYTNGTALCKGDSGGGLAFAETEERHQRYYLRGVASTAPNNDKLCNTHAVTTFTQILAHEHFIKDIWNPSTV